MDPITIDPDADSPAIGSEEDKGQQNVLEGDSEDDNYLLVTGLSTDISANELKAFFKQFGKIGRIKIMTSIKETNECERFAHVAVPTLDRVNKLVETAHGRELKGSCLTVTKAPKNGPLSRSYVISSLTAAAKKKNAPDSSDAPIEPTLSTEDNDDAKNESHEEKAIEDESEIEVDVVRPDSTEDVQVEVASGPEEKAVASNSSDPKKSNADTSEKSSGSAKIRETSSQQKSKSRKEKGDSHRSQVRTNDKKKDETELKNKSEKLSTSVRKDRENSDRKRKRHDSREGRRNRERSPRFRTFIGDSRRIRDKDSRSSIWSTSDPSSREASWERQRFEQTSSSYRARDHEVVRVAREYVPEQKRYRAASRPRSSGRDWKSSRSPIRSLLSFKQIKEAQGDRRRKRDTTEQRINYKDDRAALTEAKKQMKRSDAFKREFEELKREKEKIRLEREEIEKEKLEYLRFERERENVRMEREKIEKEKEELQRTKERMREQRQAERRIRHQQQRESSSGKTMAELVAERERQQRARETRGKSIGGRSRSGTREKDYNDKSRNGSWTTTKASSGTYQSPGENNTRLRETVGTTREEYGKFGRNNTSLETFAPHRHQFGTGSKTHVSSFLPKNPNVSGNAGKVGVWNKPRAQGKPDEWFRGTNTGGGYQNPPASMIPLPPQVNIHAFSAIPAFRSRVIPSGSFFNDASPLPNLYGGSDGVHPGSTGNVYNNRNSNFQRS